MDIKSLSELLKGTLDPTHRNEAEKKLGEVHKIIGFGPVLLQVIMSGEVELPVRQVTTNQRTVLLCTTNQRSVLHCNNQRIVCLICFI